MAKSLVDILGWEARTTGITDPAGGVPDAGLPPGFMTLTRSVPGEEASYIRRSNTRQTAELSAYDAPSKAVGKQNTAKVPVTLLHTSEHHQHGSVLIEQIMSDSQQLQTFAEDELNYQTGELLRRVENLRRAAVYSMLALGHIYFNVDALLSSSTNNTLDIDFTPTTGNANIGAWSTAATDIPGQLYAAKQAFAQDHGLAMTNCVYGQSVLGYLAANNLVSDIINGNPATAASFAAATIPPGFLGLNWYPADQMWFEDDSNDNQAFFGANHISLFPTPSTSWYEMIEGGYAVPRNLGIVAADAAAAARSGFDRVSGTYGYAVITEDPVGIKNVVGSTFLPVAKVPGSIRIVTNVTTAAS